MNMHLIKMACEWSAPREVDVVEAVGNLRPDVLSGIPGISSYSYGFTPEQCKMWCKGNQTVTLERKTW